MELRGLFEKVFNVRPRKNMKLQQAQLINGYTATYTKVGTEAYNTKIARQCIDRIATHCAKLEPKHIKSNLSAIQNSRVNYLLSNQPNPINNTYDFLYRVFSLLFTDANAFIYKQVNPRTHLVEAFYPVIATAYELYEDEKNTLYLHFRFINGKEYYVPYLEIIHLRLFYNRNDIFGTNDNVLQTDLQTVQTSSEGIKNAIQTSTSLKGILKFTNSQLKTKDVKASKEEFVNDYLSLNNSSGIAALDGKADFTPIDIKPITLDADQLERVNNNIYEYFGVSPEIINNSFTTEQWNAFYEGVVEPRAIQLSYEFTNKIFNKEAIREGNKIVFTTNRLMYATLDSKVNLLKNCASYGMIKTDEAREILGLAPLGGAEGQRILQSLNAIDTTIANQYQTSKKGEQ